VRYKPFLVGAFFGLLVIGVGTGILIAQGWAGFSMIAQQIKVLGSTTDSQSSAPVDAEETETPATSHTLKIPCTVQTYAPIGINICLPDTWKTTFEEQSHDLILGTVVFQSPDFKIMVDQGNDGSPAIKIKSGYQLSIKASRLTLDSSKATMADLNAFWESNRTEHAISRQEERTVGGQPGLYHFLDTPKEGGQIDSHVIKDPLLYDLNFYYSDQANGEGEDLYRSILDNINFETVDPKMDYDSEQIKVISLTGSMLTGQPIKIDIVRDLELEISSATQWPMVIRQAKKTGTRFVLGVAKPQGTDGDQGNYSLIWTAPEAGEYEIFAQVIKNDGTIYISAPMDVIVN